MDGATRLAKRFGPGFKFSNRRTDLSFDLPRNKLIESSVKTKEVMCMDSSCSGCVSETACTEVMGS